MGAVRGRDVVEQAEQTPAAAPAANAALTAPRRSVRSRPALSRTNVLALQVAAGNAAVARLIQRQPKPGGGIDMKTGPGGLPWPSPKGKGPTHWVMREGEVTPAWLREQGYQRVKGRGDMWQHPRTGDSVSLFGKKRPRPEAPEPGPPPPPPAPPPEPKGAWEPHDEDSLLVAEVRAEAAKIMAKAAKVGGLIGELTLMRYRGEGHSAEYDAKLAEADKAVAEIKAEVDSFNAQLPAWRDEARLDGGEDSATVDGLESLASGGKLVTDSVEPMIADLRSNRESPKPPEPSDPGGQPDPGGDGAGGGGAGGGGGGSAGGGGQGPANEPDEAPPE